MIDYIGIKMEPKEVGDKEVAQFKICCIDTVRDDLFALKQKVSHDAIENPQFDTVGYVTETAKKLLESYCAHNHENITVEEWKELYKKIKPDIERCTEEWRKGNKNILFNDLWRNTN